MDAENLRIVRQRIFQLSENFKRKYPLLKMQDAIGLALMAFSGSAIVLLMYLYLRHGLNGFVYVFMTAFLLAIIHELEHDNIHELYFKDHPWVRHLMLAVGWIFRPNSINPWIRKKIHLHHHQYSGTPEDIEERLLGNGLSYANPIRYLIAWELWFSLLKFKKMKKDSRAFNPIIMILSSLPFMPIFSSIWICWLIAQTTHFFNDWLWLLNPLMVLVVLPSWLRTFCLYTISSSVHYSAGVKGVFDQVQILTHPLFELLQIFCCWFGKTHAIHHIFVPQPFYIRHAIRWDCYKILKDAGVRFNDLGTFSRSNALVD